MSDDSVQRSSAEGDLFGRWVNHRDQGGRPGAEPRDRTRPPSWAPQVVSPRVPSESPATQGSPEPTSTQELPVVEAAADPTRPSGRRSRKPVDDEPPIRLTFAPRTKARTAVAVGTLLAAAAAVVGTAVAASEKDTASIGIAVTLWVLTAIIWAVHSGTSVTRMSVRGGQLLVLQHGVRTTIDLTSSYTPVEVHGRPGRHGWKVVFRRRDLSPFVIDHSMVDPHEFMRVLRYYRPGVDAEQS